MNFCPHCGKRLTKLLTYSTWFHRWRCDKCQLRIQTIDGDTGHGDISMNNTPFVPEIVDNEKVDKGGP